MAANTTIAYMVAAKNYIVGDLFLALALIVGIAACLIIVARIPFESSDVLFWREVVPLILSTATSAAFYLFAEGESRGAKALILCLRVLALCMFMLIASCFMGIAFLAMAADLSHIILSPRISSPFTGFLLGSFLLYVFLSACSRWLTNRNLSNAAQATAVICCLFAIYAIFRLLMVPIINVWTGTAPL